MHQMTSEIERMTNGIKSGGPVNGGNKLSVVGMRGEKMTALVCSFLGPLTCKSDLEPLNSRSKMMTMKVSSN